MALATGSQHMNLLAPASGAAPAADGAQAAAGGDAAERLDERHRSCWRQRTRRSLRPDRSIAVDVDYTGQTGFVGSPVAGAYVRQALTDVDYIRRVTFNVALVSQVSCDGTDPGRAVARRRSGGRRKAAGGYRLCRSRRRQLLPGVVGAVCDAGQPGRTNLLSLSATADHGRRGRSSRFRSTARTERTVARAAQGAVSGAAGNRSAGWRASGLLPELSARCQCA